MRKKDLSELNIKAKFFSPAILNSGSGVEQHKKDKMKRITNSFIVITLLLLIVRCAQNKEKSDRDDLNLSKKVKSVRDFEYEAIEKFGEVEKGDYYKYGNNQSLVFDEAGNQTENNTYNSDGSLDIKTTYKYDEKGNKIERNTYNSDGSIKSKLTYEYDYNTKGDWVQKIKSKNDIAKTITKREIEYFD